MRSSCSTNDPDRPAERGRIDKTHIDSAVSVTMTPHDRQPIGSAADSTVTTSRSSRSRSTRSHASQAGRPGGRNGRSCRHQHGSTT